MGCSGTEGTERRGPVPHLPASPSEGEAEMDASPPPPPAALSAPTAVTHQHLGLDCGVSPDPYGHTFLAPAACCVMNKRLVTHQLEDRPCVPTASRGQGEQSAGSSAAPG